MFLTGTVIFALASVGCALAVSVGELVAARAIQGFGGALLVPGSLAIIATSFPDKDRGRAIGTWSGFTSITAAVGPVLGGWLIDHLSWRAAFLINLPIACAVVVIALSAIPESRGEQPRASLDWLGALLAAVGLGGLVYALLESSNLGWKDPRVLGSLTAGAASLPSFLAVERRASDPMVPLELFRSRSFAGANLSTLFLYTALTGVLFFYPLNLIQVQRYTATAAGAAMLPFIVLMFLLSRWSGSLFDRFGPKRPLVIGCAIAALGCCLFAVPGIGGAYASTFLPAILVLGLGMATCVAPLTTAVMSAAPPKHAGAASGINNAVARVAGVIAIAVFSIVMLRVFERRVEYGLSHLDLPASAKSEIRNQSKRLAATQLPNGLSPGDHALVQRVIGEAFVAGFRSVVLISAGLALLAATIAGTMVGDKLRSG
jgi:EmrB/QacA subfamily drug resistance transporter